MINFKNICILCLAILIVSSVSPVYAQTITGFSPLSISAGTGSELTITGSGFGTGPASSSRYVEFANADNGGSSYIHPSLSEYISWADNEIVVRVPSDAGTGLIRVVTNATNGESASNLKVTFNIITSGSSARRHVNKNGIGGYTFQMELSFALNAPAKNAFTKSLKAWVCQSTMNWAFGAITTVNTAGNDGTNVVRFDSGSELPAGVLGGAYSYSVSCGAGNWEVKEMDLVFDKETNWNYSSRLPSSSQSDFQSVALHELGHAHGLGHVNDGADMMNYAIAAGSVRRDFTPSNIDGSAFQVNLSKIAGGGSCSPKLVPLTPAACATPFPEIDSISPMNVGRNGIVHIYGENLSGTNLITFGGTVPESFSVKSDKLVEVVVGTGFTGDVMLTTPGGTFTVAGFIFREPPDIISFNPKFGFTGDTITLTGVNFGGTNQLKFGGISAASYKIVDNEHIKAVLAGGNSGDIYISTDAGVDSISGFTFTGTTSIESVVPLAAGAGDTIVITGTNFRSITSVKFGGVPAASYEQISSTSIRAILGIGASGEVSLTSDIGSASFKGFVYLAAPLVGSFAPQSAAEGGIVKINGENFTNASEVKFGKKAAASFIVNSATQITAVVGTGESGEVSVTTPGGLGSRTGFTFIETLRINSFTPMIATTGNTVVITGTKFRNVVQVSFGGTQARSFTVNSPEQITAVVGNGTAGLVTVSTSDGAVTMPGFKFLLPPTIASFTPASAGQGSIVNINGTNLDELLSVQFGGVAATSVKVLSSTSIQAVVGPGATGAISVTNIAGTVSFNGFTFVPVPVISSIDPSSGGAGAVINIYGQHFLTTTSVSIGGKNVASFKVVSASHIVAIVGSDNLPGSLLVNTAGGAATSEAFKFIFPPVISSFSPQNAIAGVEVVITGSNFAEVTGVSFGGKAALSFKVVSPATITAIVAPGSASGKVTVTNTGGTGAGEGFLFNFTLPSNNFKISTTDITCKGSMNGLVKITAASTLNYIATLTGNGKTTAFAFNNQVEFKNYAAGNYTLCITLAGESTFKQCFEITIREPKDLALYTSINQKDNSLSIKLDGAETYFVKLNGELIKTSMNELVLKLKSGTNTLSVFSDKLCQGTLERTFMIGEGITIFPNPFESNINIVLGSEYSGKVKVVVRNIMGKTLYSREHIPDTGSIMLDLPDLAPGTYLVQVSTKDHQSVQKILRK